MTTGDSYLHDTLSRVEAREPCATRVPGNTGGAATIVTQTAKVTPD